eukprot:6899424-Pyramimonas_sp.AAC.1
MAPSIGRSLGHSMKREGSSRSRTDLRSNHDLNFDSSACHSQRHVSDTSATRRRLAVKPRLQERRAPGGARPPADQSQCLNRNIPHPPTNRRNTPHPPTTRLLHLTRNHAPRLSALGGARTARGERNCAKDPLVVALLVHRENIPALPASDWSILHRENIPRDHPAAPPPPSLR